MLQKWSVQVTTTKGADGKVLTVAVYSGSLKVTQAFSVDFRGMVNGPFDGETDERRLDTADKRAMEDATAQLDKLKAVMGNGKSHEPH